MSAEFLPAFGRTVRALRAHIDRMLSQHGLRLGQYQLLRMLWERDGRTPRELAERAGVEMPTVTRTVQRMIRDGLVRRVANPRDARSVHIFATRKGRAIAAVASRILEEGTETALAGFSARDRAHLIADLERVLANLGPPASPP